MIYYVQDCECPKHGIVPNNVNVTAKDMGGVMRFVMEYQPYTCVECGKPWRTVEEKEK